MKCKIVLFACFFLSMAMQANTFVEKEKVINKTFPIEANGTVDLSNKYGDVTILTGTSNQVEIEVKIIVDTKSDDKALEIYDRINIEFSNSPSRVSAETTISESNSKWWKGWWNSGSSEFKIHYNVKMPASAHLIVTNKYGDIFSEALNNGADVNSKYGKVDMKDIKGALNVDMKYSKGTIASGGDGTIYVGYGSLKMNDVGNIGLELSYSNFDAQNAKDVQLEMKYSKLNIGKMGHLIAESKYDAITIGVLNSLQYEAKYTGLTVNKLVGQASLDMGYGSAKIYNIQPNFSEIKIYSKYTGVKLGFATEASYQVDVENKYASVRHSGLESTIDIEKNSERTLVGYHGSKSGGMVYARMSYGGLTLE